MGLAFYTATAIQLAVMSRKIQCISFFKFSPLYQAKFVRSEMRLYKWEPKPGEDYVQGELYLVVKFFLLYCNWVVCMIIFATCIF